MYLKKFQILTITCICLVLLSACIDLNDFEKISKNVELEVSFPFYEANVFVDSLVQGTDYDLKTSSTGVYYLEYNSDSISTTLGVYDFDFDLSFQDIQLGPYSTPQIKIDFQQELFDEGVVETVKEYDLSINEITPSDLNPQIVKMDIAKGNLAINLENTFDKQAEVTLVYPNLIDNATNLSLTKTFVLSPNERLLDNQDVSDYTLDLDKGAFGYNQLKVMSNITIRDPAAQGNAFNSVIGSLHTVTVSHTLDVDTVNDITGSLPNLSLLSSELLTIPFTTFDKDRLDLDSTIKVLSSVLAFNVKSSLEVPLAVQIQDITANLVGGGTRPVPSKNPDYFFELSSPSASEFNTIDNAIIIDNSIIDEEILRDVLYDPDIRSISLILNTSISPVKATIKDKLVKNMKLTSSFSVYAPMRLDVNDFLLEDVAFDNTDLIGTIDSALTANNGVYLSKVVLAFSVQNFMPFDISPQLYLYDRGLLVDSLIMPELGNKVPKIEGAPIDYNGFVVTTAIPQEQVILIEIDKEKWEYLKTMDAILSRFRVSSVKSAKTPSVYLKNDQYFNFKFKIRKLIFSTKVF